MILLPERQASLFGISCDLQEKLPALYISPKLFFYLAFSAAREGFCLRLVFPVFSVNSAVQSFFAFAFSSLLR
jgi:hypothetical protein